MCHGSAARTLYEAETLEQQTMHLHKCDHVFFYLGGRAINRQTAIFVAASPRLKKIQYRHSPSHGSAGSSGGHGRWFPWPRPGSFSQNPSTPPKKIPWSIRSPPGLDTLEHNSLQDKTDCTGQPTHRNRKPSLGDLGFRGLYRA